MKHKMILLLFTLSLFVSCNKDFKTNPKLQNPQFAISQSSFLDKIAENDGANLGFEQVMISNPFKKINVRKLILNLETIMADSEISESYIQKRNESIKKIATKEIKNISEFDKIEVIYKSKDGEEIKSDIDLHN